jgi:hypothetical protein
VIARERLGGLLHECLRHAHGVHGIDGLVRAEADDRADSLAVGSLDDVLAAHDVGLDGLVREELTGGHLLERGGVEDEVGADHCAFDALVVSDVTDEEPHARVAEALAHVVLLGLVAAEDVDPRNASGQQVPGHRRSKRPCASGDRDCRA